MAWGDTTRKTEVGGGGVASVNVTLNDTVAGNFIAAGTSAWKSTGAPAAVAMSDGTNGAYTQSLFTSVGLTAVSLHYFANGAGGAISVTSDPSGGGAGDANDLYMALHEFSGGDTTSPASGTPATATGTSTTADTGTMTPADDSVLLLAVLDYDSSGTITENAGGEGFTLSNERDIGAGNGPDPGQPGSMVFKILSGAPGTPGHTWSFSSSADWACGIAAFKAAAAGTSILRQMLMQ